MLWSRVEPSSKSAGITSRTTSNPDVDLPEILLFHADTLRFSHILTIAIFPQHDDHDRSHPSLPGPADMSVMTTS